MFNKFRVGSGTLKSRSRMRIRNKIIPDPQHWVPVHISKLDFCTTVRTPIPLFIRVLYMRFSLDKGKGSARSGYTNSVQAWADGYGGGGGGSKLTRS